MTRFQCRGYTFDKMEKNMESRVQTAHFVPLFYSDLDAELYSVSGGQNGHRL